jgi:hypothetical protein
VLLNKLNKDVDIMKLFGKIISRQVKIGSTKASQMKTEKLGKDYYTNVELKIEYYYTNFNDKINVRCS